MNERNNEIEKNLTSLIISGTSGIARSLIEHKLKQGFKVVTTVRSKNKVKEFTADSNLIVEVADLARKNEIEKIIDLYIRDSLHWDELIICTGTMLPIQSFEKVKFDDWEKSFQINFINQMFLINKLLPFRVNNSKIILFSAGGGKTPRGFSAYNIAKVALTKSAEYLDSELEDCAVVSVGPGWVKTDIHKGVLINKNINQLAYNETVKRLKENNFVPMKNIINFFDWIKDQPKNTIGGRNISIPYDSWNEKDYAKFLNSNSDIGKLRRYKNKELNSIKVNK